MHDKLLVGTRKGLLIMSRAGGEWTVESTHFEAIPVPYALHDPRTDTLWVSLDHGHWGGKLHRSRDLGATWEEVEAPKYPEGDTVPPDFSVPAKTNYIWLIEPGGADEPNRLYLGTDPGGLFVSDDGGDSFQLMETLWRHPTNTHWFGAGRDHPGTVAIVVDPRDSRRLTVGISVGGVYASADGGETWEARNRGLYADYLPDPHHDYGHDPHIILASPSNPDVLWQQNHCGMYRSIDGGRQWRDISDKSGGPAGFGFALALDARRRARGLGGAGGQRRVSRAGRSRAGDLPHGRWRRDLARLARRLATEGLLRPGFPLRAGCPRRCAGVRHDGGQFLRLR